MITLGPLAALASSVTWAYASTAYSRTARTVAPVRVNVWRAATVLPLYLAGWAVLTLALHRPTRLPTLAEGGWLLLSTVCSYALGDSIFFAASRRIGVSTALTIASSYPLWAALAGAVGGDAFGARRLLGTLLCVGGVMALVGLSSTNAPAGTSKRRDVLGLALAGLASLMWAGNSVSVRYGAADLDVWQVNSVRYAFAVVLLLAQLRLSAPAARAPVAVGAWPRLLPAIFADAFFGSIFFVYGLSHTDLAVGATLSSLAPLISVPVAVALGEERWSPARFAAIVVTVAGTVLLVTGTGS